MSANRARDTKPELILRRALWHAGHRGYRLHYSVSSPHGRLQRYASSCSRVGSAPAATAVHPRAWHGLFEANLLEYTNAAFDLHKQEDLEPWGE